MARSLDKDPLYQQLLFSLPMREGTGTLGTADVAKPHHPVTLTHAPAWVQVGPMNTWCLTLNGAGPDNLLCASASCTDLDFTSGDFSVCVWINTTLAGTQYVMCRGRQTFDGWALLLGTRVATVETNQAGARQFSFGLANASGTWRLVGFSRSGASIRIYEGGRDDTATAATHTNPLTAARNLCVGTYYDGASSPFTGSLWNPRIWGRALRPSEHKEIYDRERGLFNV